VADETHPTRGMLLDAALELAESRSLPAMSVDEVVRAAGVSKGTFYVHFIDRSTFLVALHRRFYERLSAAVARAVEGEPAGPERLRRGTEAYLDFCLESRGVKAMLLDVRTDPAIAEEIRRDTTRFAGLAAEDYAAAGIPYPDAAARLYVTTVAEAAMVELEGGARDPAVRDALARFAGASS
jgi:TetR/AcrR family transcriptional regulator, transcriptional repressor for nem operon